MSLECKKCRTPVFDLASPCPACGALACGNQHRKAATPNRKYVLGTVLSAALLVFLLVSREEPQSSTASAVPSVRIYKGAKVYDRLTGKYAGEVIGIRQETASETGSTFQMVGLRSSTGQTEWKAQETIDRFFTTADQHARNNASVRP